MVPASMIWRMIITLLASAVSVSLVTAQMRGAIGGRGFAAHGGFVRNGARGVGSRHATRPFTRGGLLGSPFFYSDYDALDPYASEGTPFPVAVQPAAPEEPPRKIKPLLIEWQGDRYVRFGGVEETAEHGTPAHADYAEPAITTSAAQKERPAIQAAELPSAVLVYRDGHREEIADYAIADGVIYVRGNYWQNGTWTKRISLSAIDPTASMQANQQRGSKFLLPSASNVVIASF
jgi:hypothetical protein